MAVCYTRRAEQDCHIVDTGGVRVITLACVTHVSADCRASLGVGRNNCCGDEASEKCVVLRFVRRCSKQGSGEFDEM